MRGDEPCYVTREHHCGGLRMPRILFGRLEDPIGCERARQVSSLGVGVAREIGPWLEHPYEDGATAEGEVWSDLLLELAETHVERVDVLVLGARVFGPRVNTDRRRVELARLTDVREPRKGVQRVEKRLQLHVVHVTPGTGGRCDTPP